MFGTIDAPGVGPFCFCFCRGNGDLGVVDVAAIKPVQYFKIKDPSSFGQYCLEPHKTVG
jgi:hypothetical protein